MRGNEAADVAVVGGGAIGLTIALELARRGARVVVLERADDVVSGCSGGNAGLLSPGHSAPLANPAALREGLGHLLRRDGPFSLRPTPRLLPWIARFVRACAPSRVRAGVELMRALALVGLDLHARLADEGLDTGFERRGTLKIFWTDAAFAAGRRAADAHRRDGIASRALEPADARTLEPALTEAVAGAVLYPDDAHCVPERYMSAVAQAASSAGADVRTGVEVRRVLVEGGRAHGVETNTGSVGAGTVILAAGAWTATLARRLGLRLPVEGGKGYHVDLVPAETDPRLPVYLQEARSIAIPLGDGPLRLAGTLQLSGLDAGVDRVRAGAVFRAAARTIGGLSRDRIVDVWAGIRPCTPDGLPVIGGPRGLSGLVIATGHAMKGLHLAPVTARLVAELLEGADPSFGLEPFSPDRFGRGRSRSPARPDRAVRG